MAENIDRGQDIYCSVLNLPGRKYENINSNYSLLYLNIIDNNLIKKMQLDVEVSPPAFSEGALHTEGNLM